LRRRLHAIERRRQFQGEGVIITKSGTKLTLLVPALSAICIAAAISAHAQQPTIKRTDLVTADQSATDSGYLWIADIAPGGATGRHIHPTPRFVYVLEGSVVLEVDGKPDHTFMAGEGFAEAPGEVHNFRNASTTASAKALGFQVAPKGTPLQTPAQ